MEKRMRQMNVFQWGAANENYFNYLCDEHGKGYERKTTFYSDLSIAEYYGVKAIKETFRDVTAQWIDNYKFYTEFVLCLNWKCWQWYGHNDEISRVYSDLYYKARDKFYKHYERNKEALGYFFDVTD